MFWKDFKIRSLKDICASYEKKFFLKTKIFWKKTKNQAKFDRPKKL